MEKKKLFNPEAEENVRIINGDVTNILNLSDVKYPDFYEFVEQGEINQWKPQKTEMSQDAMQYKKSLTLDEKTSYDDILSFLVYLDSIQVNNLPNIADYTTAPDAVYFFARQAYEEANHSMSYGWILQSIMTKNEARTLVDRWKTNPILLERNKYIAKIYQDLVDRPSDRAYLKAVIGNYMLEGLYFYNGFQFFHNLANRGLMIGTDTQIKYIQRDELNHCDAFIYLIKNLFKENPELKDEELIHDMFKEAVEWEIKFSTDSIGDKILGMSTQSIIEHTHFLANQRLRQIGLKLLYPKVKNPYLHLEKQSGTDKQDSNRTNNFEATSINYKSPEILSDWDKI